MSFGNTLSEKWNSLCGKPTVRIRVSNGHLKVIDGKMRSAKLRELQDLFHDHGVKNVWLHYYSEHHARPLVFSTSIPKNLHQRIRNLWLI